MLKFLDATCMVLAGGDFCNEHVFATRNVGLHSITWRLWATHVDHWAVATFSSRHPQEYGYVDFYMVREAPWPFVENYERFLATWLRAIRAKTQQLASPASRGPGATEES